MDAPDLRDDTPMDIVHEVLERAIDAYALAVFTRYAPDSGVIMTLYREKEAEAARILAGVEDEPVLLAEEASVLGMPLTERAEQVMQRAQALRMKGRAIETARVTWKAALRQTTTLDEARGLLADAKRVLDAL